MHSCEFKITNTSRVKFTFTASGAIRIKIAKQHESDKALYEAIACYVAEQLGKLDMTLRGVLRPNYTTLMVFNNNYSQQQIIDFSTCLVRFEKKT